MRVLKVFYVLFLMIFFGSCTAGCSAEKSVLSSEKKTVSLVSWNVQTFFDGEKDGCEYADFQKSSYWGRQNYQERLERLCDTITTLNADIFVLIEIENKNILQDISNCLAGGGWKNKDFWHYSCFAKEQGTAIGIGILSRFEIVDFTTHSIDIRTQKIIEPSMRYLLQVTFDAGGNELVVFANHWKSMSEGEVETEIWRDWQESQLASRLNELNDAGILPAVVVCGDFNRTAENFIKLEGKNLLRAAGFGEQKLVDLQSLWFTKDGSFSTETGSYYFNDCWERIDNIFYSGDIEPLVFEPQARTPWATDGKIPNAYKLSTHTGYSDHLPLLFRFSL